MVEALVHLRQEAAVAAGVGVASLPAAAVGVGARSLQGGVRPVGVPNAGLPAGGGGWEVGEVAVEVAVGVLLREPALPQVGDLSLERTENPKWGSIGEAESNSGPRWSRLCLPCLRMRPGSRSTIPAST